MDFSPLAKRDYPIKSHHFLNIFAFCKNTGSTSVNLGSLTAKKLFVFWLWFCITFKIRIFLGTNKSASRIGTNMCLLYFGTKCASLAWGLILPTIKVSDVPCRGLCTKNKNIYSFLAPSIFK